MPIPHTLAGITYYQYHHLVPIDCPTNSSLDIHVVATQNNVKECSGVYQSHGGPFVKISISRQWPLLISWPRHVTLCHQVLTFSTLPHCNATYMYDSISVKPAWEME